VKTAALLLCSFTLFAQQIREGNFSMRFEPTAILQAKAPIPFRIQVMDANNRPLTFATVDLEIARLDGTQPAKFKAPAEDERKSPGVYIAKPVFPADGQWNVTARAKRQDLESNRTIQFAVQQ
jgi:hypothetical protein